MDIAKIKNKIEIECKKIEEEKRLLMTLSAIFNSYNETLKKIKFDHVIPEEILTTISEIKNQLNEHLILFKTRPEYFPRMHFPSFIKAIENVFNHADAIITKQKFIKLDELFIDEINKISQKESPLKLLRLIDNFNKKNEYSNNELLKMVTESGLVEIVKDLLDMGFDPDIASEQALISGHLSIIYLLKDLHEDFFYYKTKKNKNLLHIAVSAGHFNIVKFILDENKNNIKKIINVIDKKNGLTPLHYAVENSHEKIVELLIEYGADIHKINEKNQNPLQLACQLYSRYQYSDYVSTYFNIIKILLINGAKIPEEEEFSEIKILKKFLRIRNNLFLKMDELHFSKEEFMAINELKEYIEEEFMTGESELFNEVGLNLINEKILKIISCCPPQIFQILSDCGVNFYLKNADNITPINLAIELNLWRVVVGILMELENDKFLTEHDRNLLNQHHHELTQHFIILVHSLGIREKILHLKKVLGVKKGFGKAKPENALGYILYSSFSLKLFLFGKEKYRGQKVPPSIYQIVTTFSNLLSDTP